MQWNQNNIKINVKFMFCFMLATVAAADSTVRNKYSLSIYSEAEPHAMYPTYINRRVHCVFYSMGMAKSSIPVPASNLSGPIPQASHDTPCTASPAQPPTR